jgi:Chaperone of endosialidase
LTIPNQFVTGTTINAAPFNANFTAVATAVNNIDNTNIGAAGLYASQLLPTSSAQATFGGAIGYTFLAPSTSTVPLTISGVTSQSADILDVVLTNGGVIALGVNASGVLQTAQSATTGQITFGSGTTGQQAKVVLSAGLLRISPVANTNTSDFAFSTNGAVSNNLLYCSAVSISSPSIPASAAAGDLIAQRTSSAGALNLGGNSNSLLIDFNLTTGNTVSFQRPGVGYAAINGGAYTNASDASLKTNVLPLGSGLSEILALKPSAFTWIADDVPGLGFIAQEVQTVLPMLVSTDNNGIMGVNYDGIIPVLVKAFQEMTAALHAAGVSGF